MSGLAYLGVMYAGLVAVPVEERSLVANRDGFAKATGAKAVWTEQISHGNGRGSRPWLI